MSVRPMSWLVLINRLTLKSGKATMNAFQHLGPRLFAPSTPLTFLSITMLGARACRLSNNNNDQERPDQSTSQPRGSGARLSPTERIQRWSALYYRLIVIMTHYANIRRVKTILTEKVFDKIFPPIVKTIQMPPEPEVNRIITKDKKDGPEVVGRKLPGLLNAKNPPECEAALCQHPTEHMRRFGNQTDKKSWACNKCHTRWERYAAETLNTREVGPSTMMMHGKYTGHTFQQVLPDRQYIQTILMQFENDRDSLPDNLKKFAQWAAQQEWTAVDLPVSLDRALPGDLDSDML